MLSKARLSAPEPHSPRPGDGAPFMRAWRALRSRTGLTSRRSAPWPKRPISPDCARPDFPRSDAAKPAAVRFTGLGDARHPTLSPRAGRGRDPRSGRVRGGKRGVPAVLAERIPRPWVKLGHDDFGVSCV